MRKAINSSHLALRFYKHSGWTLEVLTNYLQKGRILDVWGNQRVRDYYLLDHTKDSRLDVEKLLMSITELSPTTTDRSWKENRLLNT